VAYAMLAQIPLIIVMAVPLKTLAKSATKILLVLDLMENVIDVNMDGQMHKISNSQIVSALILLTLKIITNVKPVLN
jgi:hypothetical protein